MMEPTEKADNWTIRAMPPETRKRALAGANKRGETAAQFMVRAIETQLSIDAGDRIEMPSQAAAKHQPEPLATRTGPTIEDMHAHAVLLQAATEAAKASEVMLPKTVARQAFSVLDAAQRAALGKPARIARPRKALPAIEGQVVNGVEASNPDTTQA